MVIIKEGDRVIVIIICSLNNTPLIHLLFQCSKPCGGGERSKKVVCIKDYQVVDPSACGSDKIVFSQEDCNTQPCSEGISIL